MIKWKDQLAEYENLKDWTSAVKLMQQVLDNAPDDMDAYLLTNYLLMNYLVEEEHENDDVDCYSVLLKKYFIESYFKFSHVAEYLFYTAITASMSEWYMDINIERVDEMFQNALKMEPENILYQWGYYSYFCVNEVDKQRETYYARVVLDDNLIIQLLKSKGALGYYIIGIMEQQSKRNF